MKRRIRKETGLVEEYSPEKIRTSLRRCGADEETSDEICRRLDRELPEETRSKDVRWATRKHLKSLNRVAHIRYSLKQAIFRLGPSGYPFERYFGRILQEQGFRTKIGEFVDGACVRHEVDVVAENDGERWMVECKYHNSGGKASDVKIALYVHARFLDVEKAWRREERELRFRGVLVTNTRLTGDAIDYARCTGLDVVSWRYPADQSLERLIEADNLYPVTILPSATRIVSPQLIRAGAVLARDVCDRGAEHLVRTAGISSRVAGRLVREARRLCGRLDSPRGTTG